MSIYLGSPGRMIELKCPASQQVSTDERYSFKSTLEGRRKGQVRPLGRRAWSMQTSDATTPQSQAALMQFARGAWGPGPFTFVSAEAPFTNLLTPEVAAADPGTNSAAWAIAGGPANIPEVGWTPQSFLGNGTGPILFGDTRTPVRRGIRYSVSAFVLGAGSAVRVNYYAEDGSLVGGATSTVTGNNNGYIRSHISVVIAAGVASIVVSAVNSIRATLPQVTEGPGSPLPWSDGRGCDKSVVHEVSSGLVLTGPSATYSNMTFTVTEVG